MCLRVQNPKVHCCIKPIKAYKVLLLTEDERYISPYKRYDYTKYVKDGTLVEDCIPKPIFNQSRRSYEVHEGLHLNSDIYGTLLETRIARSQAFGNKVIIFECEIPPGATYISGEWDVCTNQFRFIRKV